MSVPHEIYYAIASFTNDIPSFTSLSVCCRNSFVGCQRYKEHIIRKHNKIAIWYPYSRLRSLYYLTLEEFRSISYFQRYYGYIDISLMGEYKSGESLNRIYEVHPCLKPY